MTAGFRRNWKTYLAWFLGLSALTFVGAHYVIERSDAFETATSFVRENPEVIRHAGAVREITLSWSGASIEVSGGNGSAQLTLNVSGTASSPQAYVELKKRGIWEVTFARLLPAAGSSIVLQEATK